MLLLIRRRLGERPIDDLIFTEGVLLGCPQLLILRVEALVIEDFIVSSLLRYVFRVMGGDTHNLV